MCTGSMISPVAPITTVKYEATYQCDGFTGNASSGSVPKTPPMMSIETMGKPRTKVRVSESRVSSRSSVVSSRRVVEGCLRRRVLVGPGRACGAWR